VQSPRGICPAGLWKRVGMAVDLQAFYDQYPYPPPVADLDAYRRRWQESARRRADFHLFWPTRPYREDYSILVAGCGTSQAAKYAIRWPAAQITGIDLSATSLRHTEELKRKYQLDNLQVHQLPLERASELGKSFDQVVCTGVLHHLPDPDAGLRALRGVLEPHGALHLMVYAPYGRAGIYMLQLFRAAPAICRYPVPRQPVAALPTEPPPACCRRHSMRLPKHPIWSRIGLRCHCGPNSMRRAWSLGACRHTARREQKKCGAIFQKGHP
jgi:SAM-dependent methyltransferase